MILEITITNNLKNKPGNYDIPSIVKGYVTEFGFVDIDEVDPEAYRALVQKHRKRK
jgi:hypothetical protein